MPADLESEKFRKAIRGIDENVGYWPILVGGTALRPPPEAVAGLGNAALASRVRKAPRFRTPRRKGQSRDLTESQDRVATPAWSGFRRPENLAGVGDFGALPKIADYLFTTPGAQPGVVSAGEYVAFVVADVLG